MFCQNCACELPAVARFCVKCGSRVHWPTSIARTSQPACVNCGRLLDRSDHFCNHCGRETTAPQAEIAKTSSDAGSKSFEKVADADYQLNRAGALLTASSAAPQVHTWPTEVAATSAMIDEASTGIGSQTTLVGPPYARYVIHLLLFYFSFSVGIFALFDALARNSTALTVELLSILVASVFGWIAWTTWKSILKREPKNDLKSRRRVRNTLVNSIIFAFLYLGLAGVLGSVIGQNRAEAVQLNVDTARQKEIADSIGKARTSVSSSIPAYLAMYRAIEPEVSDYTSTLAKPRKDLDIYDVKFPAQRDSTREFIFSVKKEIRRSELLTKQITVAKQIELLDPDQQSLAWRRDMLPLLEAENTLDKSK
jgi:Double zinc ribbon